MINSIRYNIVQSPICTNQSVRKPGVNTQEVKYDAITPSFKGDGDKRKSTLKEKLMLVLGSIAAISTIANSILVCNTFSKQMQISEAEGKYVESKIGDVAKQNTALISSNLEQNKMELFKTLGIQPDSQLADEIYKDINQMLEKLNKELVPNVVNADTKDAKLSVIDNFLKNINVDDVQRQTILSNISPQLEMFTNKAKEIDSNDTSLENTLTYITIASFLPFLILNLIINKKSKKIDERPNG